MKSLSIHTLISQHRHLYDITDLFLVETLKDINVITSSRINPQHKKLLSHFPEVVRDIEDATSFMPPTCSVRERIMLVVEGHQSVPICRGCGRNTTFNRFAKRWNHFCGSKCPHILKRSESLLGTDP